MYLRDTRPQQETHSCPIFTSRKQTIRKAEEHSTASSAMRFERVGQKVSDKWVVLSCLWRKQLRTIKNVGSLAYSIISVRFGCWNVHTFENNDVFAYNICAGRTFHHCRLSAIQNNKKCTKSLYIRFSLHIKCNEYSQTKTI